MDASPYAVSFGRYRFDAADGTLLRDGERIALTPRGATLLSTLLANANRLVTREELARAVWGETFVDDNNLHQQIAILRRAIGAEWIETVPRRGYRFIFPQVQTATSGAAGPRRIRWRAFAAAALAMIVLASCILIYQHERVPPRIAVDSVAILPLKTLTPSDPADDFLSLGVTDALISRLGSLGTIDVRPLSAVHPYRGIETDAVTAGRRLHVDAVLDGTTQRSGTRVRLNLRLVEVVSGRQVWASTYEEELGDLFETQERISRAVFDALAIRLAPHAERRQYAAVDAAVVEMYLRGRHHFARRRREDFEKSAAWMRKALARAPEFAPAWAGLGDALNFLGQSEEAEKAVRRALELDPTLADAHATLGNLLFFHGRRFDAAEREFQLAIQLNPSCTNARHWYAYLHAARGRATDARRELDAALRVDPLSLPLNTSVGSLLYLEGRFDEAAAAFRRTLDLDPEYKQARIELGLALAARGDVAGAKDILAKVLSVDDRNPSLAGYLAALSHDRDGAAKMLERITPRERLHPSGDTFWIAATYSALGETDAALEWVERSTKADIGDVVLAGVDPKFRPLRHDARFREILRKAGIG